MSSRSGARKDGSGPNLFQGAMSIQNSLICAFKSHRTLPKYGRREILMILGAIASQDPSHPASCLSIATSTRTSISVIHLAAEMFICKRLANETGGILNVPLSEPYLVQTLATYASLGISALSGSAPPSSGTSNARLLIMGFPTMKSDSTDVSSFSVSDEAVPYYTCPKCLHCLPEDASLPTNCPICRLMLVKSQQLSRSYSHLFPQPSLKLYTLDAPHTCYGCSSLLPASADVIPLPEAQPIMSFHSNIFQAPSSTAAGDATSTNAPNIPLTSQCYECQDCKSLFCGLCKEGISVHLHQCIGCLELGL